MITLATIGYEGATLADFIATLSRAGIKRAIDVREIAQSRRPGFSKNALRNALAEAGIDYHHIRQLGDPKHGREAARAGDMSLFRDIFSAHMDLLASREALTDAQMLASEKKSVLICFERDPKYCHRTIVAERMAGITPMKIKHLGVQPECTPGAKNHVAQADRHAGSY